MSSSTSSTCWPGESDRTRSTTRPWPTWRSGPSTPPGRTRSMAGAGWSGRTWAKAWMRHGFCCLKHVPGWQPTLARTTESSLRCRSATYSSRRDWPMATTSSRRCSPTTWPTAPEPRTNRSTRGSLSWWTASWSRWWSPPTPDDRGLLSARALRGRCHRADRRGRRGRNRDMDVDNGCLGQRVGRAVRVADRLDADLVIAGRDNDRTRRRGAHRRHRPVRTAVRIRRRLARRRQFVDQLVVAVRAAGVAGPVERDTAERVVRSQSAEILRGRRRRRGRGLELDDVSLGSDHRLAARLIDDLHPDRIVTG